MMRNQPANRRLELMQIFAVSTPSPLLVCVEDLTPTPHVTPAVPTSTSNATDGDRALAFSRCNIARIM